MRGSFARNMVTTAANAPMPPSMMAACSPKLAYSRMPSAGAAIIEMLPSSVSRLLMRTRCRSGTSSGMVALNAGARKPAVKPYAAQNTATAATLGPASAIHAAMAMPLAAKMASQIIMISLAVALVGDDAAEGERSPMGRNASTYRNARADGEPVVSVTYQIPA